MLEKGAKKSLGELLKRVHTAMSRYFTSHWLLAFGERVLSAQRVSSDEINRIL